MQIQGNIPKPAGPEARPSACPARPDRLPSGKRVQRYALMRNGQTKQGTFFKENQGGQENTLSQKHAVTQDNTRGKSFEKKEEGRETDTSIILYIRTEDGRNRYKKRRKTLLFFLVHLFRLNYVSHNQACSTAQKHTCTINDRNRTSHKPIIMFVIKILRQSNSHNRIAYQKP